MSTHYHSGRHWTYGPGMPDGETPPPDAIPRPVVDPNTHEVIHWPHGYEIRARPVDVRIAQAWEEADALALSGADHNSRAQFLAWLIDPNSSAERKARIHAVQAWMGGIWQTYGVFRAELLAGQTPPPFSLSHIGPCPWTFWDVAGA